MRSRGLDGQSRDNRRINLRHDCGDTIRGRDAAPWGVCVP
jgi:hypothetical protein